MPERISWNISLKWTEVKVKAVETKIVIGDSYIRLAQTVLLPVLVSVIGGKEGFGVIAHKLWIFRLSTRTQWSLSDIGKGLTMIMASYRVILGRWTLYTYIRIYNSYSILLSNVGRYLSIFNGVLLDRKTAISYSMYDCALINFYCTFILFSIYEHEFNKNF